MILWGLCVCHETDLFIFAVNYALSVKTAGWLANSFSMASKVAFGFAIFIFISSYPDTAVHAR